MQAYCSQCKTMRDITNAQVTRTADGKPLTRGTCAVCSGALMRLGSATDDGRRRTEERKQEAEGGRQKAESQPPNSPQPELAIPAPTAEKPVVREAKETY